MTADNSRTALVLPGGGARAAYQAGVLAAIRDLLPDATVNPFPILCGTSAGAINAATLACNAGNFRAAVEVLNDVWRNMRASDVYRADALGVATSGARWLSSLALGWFIRRSPRSLLDNEPLRQMLLRRLDFANIDRNLADGALRAVSVTASGYTSGHSVTFFQAHAEVDTWTRTHRFGCRDRLGVEHLMASSAIPFVFPAVKLNREWFGDGSMRQLAPISPAIHLGAEKVLVIGAGRINEQIERRRGETYPSLAQVAGHALSSIFLDGLSVDIERMQRINRTLSVIPDEVKARAGIALRPIETLVIAPSQRLDFLAARHARALPRAVRVLLRGMGAMNRAGGALTSYLLFEQPYTRALIELGYRDTEALADEVRAFLGIS
ncbi:patatin-like phospholipase family protein [Azospira restricta]|uniref:Patatin-like phospholipase family protein n=1 Tax=Azospira restricta TaxID=404405 RepID=A0A974SRK7_9RHOO|nr:patatin-like phospholipase family protein [Azospira restricta]QRJ65215.1 patatin-like phospholipase family protein [Azospira restricta]